MNDQSVKSGADNRERRLAVALHREKADAVIRDCAILDVHTGLSVNGGIAIVGDRIAYVGEVDDLIGSATTVIEGHGRIAVPGLIEGHIHTYESHLPISEIARGFLRHGVTTIVTDFYGEAVVRGMGAVRASLAEAATTSLNVVFILPMPALYQDGPFGHTGTIDLAAMEEMASWPQCHGLNECFIQELVDGEPMLRKLVDIVQARGGKICGHASEGSERQVNAWAGWVRRIDDHESVSGDEALLKLRSGVHIIAREGSGVADVANIVRTLLERGADFRRVSFCTDLISPVDILARGSIDYCVRLCIGLGVPPVTAVQMATINAAECHQIDHDVGSLSPGRRADVILLRGALAEFEIDMVVSAGKAVAEKGQNLVPRVSPQRPAFAYRTVDPGPIAPDMFVVSGPQDVATVTARVIGVRDGTIITSELERTLRVERGVIKCSPSTGINTIAAVDRHTGKGTRGLGFAEGFGLRSGAMASTYNPQYQDLLVVGATPEDMAAAASECVRLGGGFAVVNEGRVIASVPLPLYGLLSEESIDTLGGQIEAAIAALRGLGCPLSSPFHTLAFSGLPLSIGRLKINSRGLVDVWRGEVVPLVIRLGESLPA
jgi:adenine deaminase